MDPEELYQEYARIIYRYIYLKCRDADLAEEILQTTFLKAIQQVDTFRGKAKVSTWLCQIAKMSTLISAEKIIGSFTMRTPCRVVSRKIQSRKPVMETTFWRWSLLSRKWRHGTDP